MELTTAVLCDFAQVRDRLLFISSGAVTRLYRHALPAPLGLMVGVVIDVPLEDALTPHTLTAQVVNRHGDELAALSTTFEVGNDGLFPHEVQQVPFALSVTGVAARTWGTHQVRLSLDDQVVRRLTFYVVPSTVGASPATPAAVAGEPDGGPAGPAEGWREGAADAEGADRPQG